MIELIKKYVDNRVQLIKLELISTLANVVATLVNSFFILIIAIFILLMFSLSLAFWLSELFNSNTIGFAIIGGIYVLIFIVYLLFSKSVVDSKVKDGIVKAALTSEEDSRDSN
jgi:putative superfamily III holin-X